VGLRIESGAAAVTSASWPSALYVAAGTEPFDLLRRGVAAAAALSGAGKPRSDKTVPPSVDCFGWCTWDAFYSKVSAAGIQKGLKSLVEGGTPARWLIIDDGWQQTDVDQTYRAKPAAPGTQARGTGAVSDAGQNTSAADGLALGSAVHEVEEAAAELLAGPGDQLPHQLHAEHELDAEEAARKAALRARQAKFWGTPDTTQTGLFAGLFALVASVVASLRSGWATTVAHAEAGILRGVKAVLDGSSAESWVIRGFTRLAQGPLRATIQRFYASATDHARRLTSVRANAKFAAADSDGRYALSVS
jgi:Raffinose synthase or seed imbibition protein Sip1